MDASRRTGVLLRIPTIPTRGILATITVCFLLGLALTGCRSQNSLNKDLMRATNQGSVSEVSAALAAGAEIDAHNLLRMAALHSAVYQQIRPMLQHLLEAVADSENRSKKCGYPSLNQAASYRHDDLFEWMQRQRQRQEIQSRHQAD